MTRKPSAIATPVLCALVSALASSPVNARPSGEHLPFAAEIDSCLATVNAQLDLEGARRVRHLVSEARRTGIGYALTIETSVFLKSAGGPVEKRYEVYCVARGDSHPAKFRIEEIEI